MTNLLEWILSDHAHIQLSTTGPATMPVNGYSGFYKEDESIEHAFALQHETRTMLNSQPAISAAQVQEVFIPTLLAYCGTFQHPWDLPQPLGDIIAELWPFVFPPSLPYDAQLYVFFELLYDWCSKLSGAAEKNVGVWLKLDRFLDDDDDDDDDEHITWADWALDEHLNLPFIYLYIWDTDNHGVGAFYQSLTLQSLAYHYTRIANTVPCSQIKDALIAALALISGSIEKTGHIMEEGKSKAGPFSEKGRWGKSSVSYSVSIKELDPCTLIIDHYDDTDDIESIEQPPASIEDIEDIPMPVSASHIHNTSESQSLLNSSLCPDLATDIIAVTDIHCHSQPLISISLPFMQEDPISQNLPVSSSSSLCWVNPHSNDASTAHKNISSTGMFMCGSGGFVKGHLFTMLLDLKHGNTGPLVTIDMDIEH
ncbi:hypothetical protein V8B97DRAFT_2026598 [Scleroderma yunnanense]